VAFEIRFKSPLPAAGGVAAGLVEMLESSRFAGVVQVLTCNRVGRPNRITVTQVRLRAPKPYCGAHPGACLVERPHRNLRFLEGADWIAFNDLVNTVLDRLDVDADVGSSVCNIRRGRCRRVAYCGKDGAAGHAEWEKFGDMDEYENRCRGFDAAGSRFPPGTPGNPEWRVGCV
jgi:hypothetical protein